MKDNNTNEGRHMDSSNSDNDSTFTNATTITSTTTFTSATTVSFRDGELGYDNLGASLSAFSRSRSRINHTSASRNVSISNSVKINSIRKHEASSFTNGHNSVSLGATLGTTVTCSVCTVPWLVS